MAAGSRVVEINVDRGALVSVGDPLLRVTTEEPAVLVDLTPNQRGSVEVGMAVSVLLQDGEARWTGSVASLDDFPTEASDGSLSFVGVVSIDDGADLGSLIGRPIRAEVTRAELAEVLVVPISAITTGAGGRPVVTVSTAGGEQVREVEVGRRSLGMVEILDGLAEGETVLASVG